ncbi:MAG: alpha/beta hydrolase, partial [Firmicutes bacterium]|nr:alpha/beta hydrolase [Bacillota bacterium]
HACMDDRVEFVIADSPWSDLERLLAEGLLRKGYPTFPVLQTGDWICRMLSGFSLKDVSPEKAMKGRNGLLSVPVLFIAGEKDALIPAAMARRLYQMKQGAKVLYLCSEGERGRNWSKDPVQYESQITAFLQENIQTKRAVI